MPPSYLDYAATTPVKPEVIKVVSETLAQHGNASSVHGFGRAAREKVEGARQIIGQQYGVKPAQVIFTSGATEANNMALHAFKDRRVIVSSIEHPSVLQTACMISDSVQHVSVNADGVINLNHLEELLKASPQPALVSVMLVNNETGVIQPIAEIAELAKKHGAILHCDAVQGAGRLKWDIKSLGADLISISAHKIGGPQGVGALLVRENMPLSPFMHGGTQEQRRRAGTENVAGIAGFGKAVSLVNNDLEKQTQWATWRDVFEARITDAVPEAVVFGKKAARVAGISCISMPMARNDTQLMAFDLAGFAVSSGSACSSGKVQASPVLKAMGVDEQAATSAIRVSFGWDSREEELQNLTQSWLQLYERTRKA